MTLEIRKQETLTRLSLTGLTLLLILGIHEVHGGCSRFGHSCFGAHGKRGENVPGGSSVDYSSGGAPGDLGYGQPSKPELYNSYQQQQQPSRYYTPNRIPPYLFEWALAAQKAADLRQPHEQLSKEDSPVDMRKK